MGRAHEDLGWPTVGWLTVFAVGSAAITLSVASTTCAPFGSEPALGDASAPSDADASVADSDVGGDDNTPRIVEDDIAVGDGRDGVLTASGSNKTVNDYFAIQGDVEAGASSITLTDGTSRDLAGGDVVMIWEPAGLTQDVPRNAPVVKLVAGDYAGRYELVRVKPTTKGSTTIELEKPLAQPYRAPSQVIRIPQYDSVTIPSGTSLAAKAFDGTVGGIIAFVVRGDLVNDGKIQANEKGFKGGVGRLTSTLYGCDLADADLVDGYARKGTGVDTRGKAAGPANSANAGGGGACHNAAGGGGGLGGAGGRGAKSYPTDPPATQGRDEPAGIGGARIDFDPRARLVMDGGGGAGEVNDGMISDGGDGGGVVFLRASAIGGQGTIEANGENGEDSDISGASGGGAGGLIFVSAKTTACASASAKGGKGGDIPSGNENSPGGGGGGGVAWVDAPLCPPSVVGGAAGSIAGLGPRGETKGDLGRVKP